MSREYVPGEMSGSLTGVIGSALPCIIPHYQIKFAIRSLNTLVI